MSKGRINYYLRYGLVVLITLAFVVATYFIVKSPKISCEAQGKVADPTPGHHGQCLEPCKRDKYRCVTDNCKARWDKNTGVVCSDCEIGKIPLKDEGANTYNCVPECTAGDSTSCNDWQSCVAINKYDKETPYYCISNLYSCQRDPKGTGGHVCVRTQGSGDSLNDCLNRGHSGDPCSCVNRSNTMYALNNENNACDTFVCSKYGKYGYGSDRTDQKKNGTCYALDSDTGFLLNPNDPKNSDCTDNETQKACNNMNKEKWQCKWVRNDVFIVPGSNDMCNQKVN